MSTYLEHDKLHAIAEKSQAIGEFIDNSGYTLCRHQEAGANDEPEYVWIDGKEHAFPPKFRDYTMGHAAENPEYIAWGEGHAPDGRPIAEILAEYFGIDQKKLDEEKDAMLEAQRAS